MRGVLQKSFWQLIVIYVILSVFITLNAVPRYAFHFELLALMIALIGGFSLDWPKESDEKYTWIIWVSAALIIILRILPYIHNTVPIGYDAAFYTAAIDQYAENRLENWFFNWAPPGLFMFTDVLKTFGIRTDVILTAGVILFELLLGLMVYLVAKELFNKKTAAFSLLLYSVSLAQYETFQLMYLKNIVGMIFMLAAILFVQRKQYLLTAASGIIVAAVHRPAFLLFGLCYFFYTILQMKDRKEFIKLLATGGVILAAALSLYLSMQGIKFFENHYAALAQNSGGSFPTFIQYLFRTLPYIVFSGIGYFFAIRRKQFNMIFLWSTITFLIVSLRLFFYNRFVIFLDIGFLIFAGYALEELHSAKKNFTTAIIAIITAVMLITTGTAALNASPNISPEEYAFMQNIQNITEQDSLILSNMVDDAHWLEALAHRPVAAAGMFDYGKWTHTEWRRYWSAKNFEQVKDLMDRHPRPLYIYIGEKSPRGSIEKFSTCTETVAEEGKMKLMRYTC